MHCAAICFSAGLALISARSVLAADRTSWEAVKQFEAKHPGVLRVGGEVLGPKLVRKVNPEFPKPLRLKFRELSPIIVEAIVTETGDVLDPTVVMSAHPDLDPLVLTAIRQWKYEPARRRGKRVPVFLTVTVLLEPTPA
jgi:TonB family protein